jgi:hypothetical protein
LPAGQNRRPLDPYPYPYPYPDQGRKLALLVDFDQQALFPEPLEAPPEIGKEHLIRLAKGHLIRLDLGNRSQPDTTVSDTF